jgi:hypothetical protein
MTMGITDVACFAAMVSALPKVAMTSTSARTKSRASPPSRSALPSEARRSKMTFWPSIQPKSRNADTQFDCLNSVSVRIDPLLSSPIR